MFSQDPKSLNGMLLLKNTVNKDIALQELHFYSQELGSSIFQSLWVSLWVRDPWPDLHFVHDIKAYMPYTDLDILYQFLRHFMTVLPYIYFIGVEPVHCSGRLHSEEDTRTEAPGSRQTKPTGPTGCPESWHNKPKTPI